MQTLQIVESSSEISVLAPAETVMLPEVNFAGSSAGAGLAQSGLDAELPPILIADDDEDDVFFLQRLIKRTGVKNRVLTFNDGTEVVNYLGGAKLAASEKRRRCPRLLFLDLNMAGLGGFGFLEWARQQRELSPLVIVILSNSNASEDVSRAMALGAHRYLVKYPCAQTITTIVRSVYPLTFN